jgi:hypothetical protein
MTQRFDRILTHEEAVPVAGHKDKPRLLGTEGGWLFAITNNAHLPWRVPGLLVCMDRVGASR